MDPVSAKVDERQDIVLDLDRLKRNCNNNRTIIVELLNHLYQKSGPKWIGAIEEGIKSENSKEIREVCHGMKGASATVFAWRISNLALEFESLARDENIQGLSDRMGELKNAFVELEKWIKAQPDLA
jgi:HPt (histidine-containing phosphotransfer) domain-containing protein